jgi:hypothetical protein
MIATAEQRRQAVLREGRHQLAVQREERHAHAHSDAMTCTAAEYKDLLKLRAMRRDLYGLTADAVTTVSVVDLLYVLDGE